VPVRPASEVDLAQVVALSAEVRSRLALFDPHFWRPHAAADETQLAWFSYLLQDPGHVVLVADEESGAGLGGFIIGRLMDAPPVYDPGGRACMVDDFAWRSSGAAEELLAAAKAWAVEQHAVTLVVVTAVADRVRRDVLHDAGLHATSEWWSTELR
jgi:GNAT superfamily N-acetyltransferase